MLHGFRHRPALKLLAGTLAISAAIVIPAAVVAIQRSNQPEAASKPAQPTPGAGDHAGGMRERVTANAVSGFPSPTTAGVPAETPLSDYDGPMEITIPGTVIEGKIIAGSLRVTASDVIIKNCVVKFNATWGIDAEGARNITIRNSEFVGPGYSGQSNSAILGSGNFVGNDISKVENGITLTGEASTVTGNYIHDLESAGTDPHYDGISVQGGQNGVLIQGNTILARDTSAIFIKNDFGPIANVIVTDNLLLGIPSYPVYVDGRAGGGPITGVSIINNHVEKGAYGYYSVDESDPVISGNVEYPTGKAPAPGGSPEIVR